MKDASTRHLPSRLKFMTVHLYNIHCLNNDFTDLIKQVLAVSHSIHVTVELEPSLVY